MNVNKVIAKAIYDKLSSVSAITDLIETDETGIKIWYGAARPKLESAFPYILMSYASGGLLNDAPYEAADVTFMITGVDLTKPGAEALAALIDANLRRQVLTYSDGWISWSTVRQVDQYSRVENVQQVPYQQEGAYYRFRISKGL